uniref:Uncharacterized protein n=3 Tax=Aegilops tauschii subsp. strangulata TaxID=200361 RepID=A0A453Q4W3_AEGTS
MRRRLRSCRSVLALGMTSSKETSAAMTIASAVTSLMSTGLVLRVWAGLSVGNCLSPRLSCFLLDIPAGSSSVMARGGRGTADRSNRTVRRSGRRRRGGVSVAGEEGGGWAYGDAYMHGDETLTVGAGSGVTAFQSQRVARCFLAPGLRGTALAQGAVPVGLVR